jgi:alpha 1,3-glucosidase
VSKIPSGIDYIPVFQRGGSIIPRKLRLRRSTMTMRADPYTLYVALDSSKKATGTLYMDDEESFGYKRFAEFAKSTFTADLNGKTATFVNSVSVGAGWAQDVEEMSGS